MSESNGSIRCVCFDWGGVILRHCRSWDEACAYACLPVRPGITAPELVERRRALNHRYTLGQVETEAFFHELTEHCAGLYTQEEVRHIHAAWLTSEYQGVDRIIQRLNRSAHVQTGLLSNTCAAHWARHLPGENRPADFPTIGLISHRHASHLLGVSKPSEEAYRAFERATGFQGSSILLLDDLPDNVDSARRLGWQAHQIDHTLETAPQIEACLARHGLS